MDLYFLNDKQLSEIVEAKSICASQAIGFDNI